MLSNCGFEYSVLFASNSDVFSGNAGQITIREQCDRTTRSQGEKIAGKIAIGRFDPASHTKKITDDDNMQ